MNFKSAFAAARKAGKKVFTWNGKRYNTKLAKTPKKNVPMPPKAERAGVRKGTGTRKARSAASKAKPTRKALTAKYMPYKKTASAKTALAKRPSTKKPVDKRPVKKTSRGTRRTNSK